ncbi:MAG: TolC family protein [Acidobacteria bacterium]|nr:TolC family protein [Acidobacteriota bacterium]
MTLAKRFVPIACLCLTLHAYADSVPFRRAIELAVANSSPMAVAGADQSRAQHAYQEARNLFLPQMVLGSGMAASYGFPLSIEGAAPSIISLNSQQHLFNPAQKEFIRAARSEWNVAGTMKEDRRDQVILDAALTYIELDKLAAALTLLRQQEEAAARIEQIVEERIAAGVDSEVERTRARLAAARVRMQLAEAQGTWDVLRLRLAHLTGLPEDSIATVTESIPELPDIRQEDNLVGRALEKSPLVRVADERAEAQQFRAKGERKMLYPAFDLVGQYGLFSRHNNYDEFFQRFQRHNGTFGVAIRFPFLNLAQRSRAEAAEAEVVMVRSQAKAVRNQVSAETLRLQRSARQLGAAREVARLEYQLARSEVDAAQARIEAGTGTLREEHQARALENERYKAFLDASFELEKVQLQLLRATGELEKWAMK